MPILGWNRFVERLNGIVYSVCDYVSDEELERMDNEKILDAHGETTKTVTRLSLTLLGFGFFCFIALTSPDSFLLGGKAKINLPFVGQTSFKAFLVVGPTILIGIWVYLYIYVEHLRKIHVVAQKKPNNIVPVLYHMRHPLIKLLSLFILYILPPLVMVMFTWKSFVFPLWGYGLTFITITTIGLAIVLIWRTRSLLSFGAILLVAVIIPILSFFAEMRRPFDLAHAELANMWLANADLRGADLEDANLEGTNLSEARLLSANLTRANLRRVDLWNANLQNANLSSAKIHGTNFHMADLVGANFTGAKVKDADISFAKLHRAEFWLAELRDTNIGESNLQQASFREATLEDVDFAYANFKQADLRNAKFKKVNFYQANFEMTDFTNSELGNINFSRATLEKSIGLFQELLQTACGDEMTKVPKGIELAKCPQETVSNRSSRTGQEGKNP